MTLAVRARGIVRRFTAKGVLNGVDLDIAEGEFVALLGRSGSGKTTLLRALAGLDHDTQGEGEIAVPPRIAVAFQDARLLPWKNVIDNVVLGLNDPQRHARGLALLEEVGLTARAQAWPHELSGGEQQRAALARSLIREPALLLADEPFGALDALTRIKMHVLLRRLVEKHRPAVLMVTHDVSEAVSLADRVLVLDSGRIVRDLPVVLPPSEPERRSHREQLERELLTLLGVEPAPGIASPIEEIPA